MLGLVRENDGVAAWILYESGLTAQTVARATLSELGCPPELADRYSDEPPRRRRDEASVMIGGRRPARVFEPAMAIAAGVVLLGLGVLIGWLVWG